jgi:hypothetical protein
VRAVASPHHRVRAYFFSSSLENIGVCLGKAISALAEPPGRMGGSIAQAGPKLNRRAARHQY